MRGLGCHFLSLSLGSWTAFKMAAHRLQTDKPLQTDIFFPALHLALPVVVFQHPVQSLNVGLHHCPLGVWLLAVHSQLLPVVAILKTKRRWVKPITGAENSSTSSPAGMHAHLLQACRQGWAATRCRGSVSHAQSGDAWPACSAHCRPAGRGQHGVSCL